MKVQRVGVLQAGVESVIVDTIGCVNFQDGIADIARPTALALIRLGAAFALNPGDVIEAPAASGPAAPPVAKE